MTVTIRRPAGGDAIGKPDVAIGCIGTPGAVRIEIFIANHILRHIAGGARVVVAAIAIAGPSIEFVAAPRVEILVLAQAGSGEAVGLPRVNHVRRTVAIYFAAAPANDQGRRIAIGVHFDPVFAGFPQTQRKIRRIHFKYLVAFKTAHTHVQRALRQLQLGDSIVEVEYGEAGKGV